MRAGLLRICLICGITIALTAVAVPQKRNRRQDPPSNPPSSTAQPSSETSPEPTPEPTPPDEDPEVVKVDTNLVTVPLIAATVAGNYVPDLTQAEINISEDGVKQDVAFFATVSAPFHVVLMIDTSASTQQKLGLIRNAAIAFVEQLQPGDRVKVISFDDQVRDLNEFTNSRATLRSAINKTVPGRGTKVYDAFELALSSIRKIQGRKAIVLFSDGMDWHSDRASFDSTLHWLDEEEVVIYPIRYETRAETERLAREQAAEQGSGLPTLDNIRRSPSGTTAPTFPSDDPESAPTISFPGKNGPLAIPDILRRKREIERDTGRGTDPGSPRPDRVPPSTDPTDPRRRTDDGTIRRRGSRPGADDSITAMLNQAYLTADSYLTELAQRSGGRLLRADTLDSLPDAFAQIAAELRTQYAVGYYPTNRSTEAKYRKIKITTTRKNTQIRARPGYRR
ncbi:MAG TPA: VWA domain-containing protein [Pyrinomonadaceae bacterium]|nr:VWA domain-containing protein [Pyrinomonadaceae bacterium]